MSSQTSSRTVDQVRVILGLFRETIFLQTRYEVKFESFEELLSAELVEVEESTRRHENERRTLVFHIIENSQALREKFQSSQNSQVIFRFGIDSFLVKAVSKLNKVAFSQSNQLLYVDVPATIEIENARKNRRKKSKANLGIASVLVRSGNAHTEGVLELNDYSLGGYGGTLQVPHGFELISDTFVSGRLTLGSETLAISCYVKRAKLIAEKSGNWDSYSVGLQTEVGLQKFSEVGAQQTSSQTDRRRNARIVMQEQIDLTSAINPDVSFRLQLDEASVTGFSGKLINAAHLVEFPLGSCFKMGTPPLSVILQGFEGERLRFSIQDGSVNDRLEWFKRVSPYLLKGVSHSVYDARDLLEVFCASGALSSEYLKTQRTHSADFLSPFETSTRDQFWIHRWIHHNENKEVTGHWGALRLGDNGWFLADLAGSPEKIKKIPKNFTEQFFKSFSEFCLTASPCPVNGITWVHGHPYWKQFAEKLASSKLIQEKVTIGYTRYSSKQTVESVDHRITTRPILAAEHDTIHGMLKLLAKQGMEHHASLFDFEVGRFGSPLLSQGFRGASLRFSREYFEFVGAQSRWLVVLSSFPKEGSFNRIPESIWAFPVEGTEECQSNDWPTMIQALFAHALSHGIKPSSIRRIARSDSSLVCTGEHALMESLILHPSALKLVV